MQSPRLVSLLTQCECMYQCLFGGASSHGMATVTDVHMGGCVLGCVWEHLGILPHDMGKQVRTQAPAAYSSGRLFVFCTCVLLTSRAFVVRPYRHVDASIVSAYTTVQPVASSILSFVFLKVQPSLADAGGAIVALGMFVVVIEDRRRRLRLAESKQVGSSSGTIGKRKHSHSDAEVPEKRV